MEREGADFRPLPLPRDVTQPEPKDATWGGKDGTLPTRPCGTTVRVPSLNASSGHLYEGASGRGGFKDLCAQDHTMRPIGGEPWGDMERLRSWFVEHLGLYALLPDTKHIPEDLKAKIPVRVNTQGM